MERISTCPDCQGKGIIRYQKPVRRGSRYLTAIGCPTCGGYGEETQRRDRSARQSHLRPGSGQLVEVAQCEACGGQGKVRI
jgi:DnaJ-class molecular chaperone